MSLEQAPGDFRNGILAEKTADDLESAEEALRFLASVVESPEDGIVTYSPARIILTWNHGAETIHGYSAAEAIGQSMDMLLPSEGLADMLLAELAKWSPATFGALEDSGPI